MVSREEEFFDGVGGGGECGRRDYLSYCLLQTGACCWIWMGCEGDCFYRFGLHSDFVVDLSDALVASAETEDHRFYWIQGDPLYAV